MKNWKRTRLGEHIKIRHGFAFQGEYFSNRGKYIVLTPGNFIDAGGFKPKSGVEKFYSVTPPSEYVLRRGDLVVAMTEQVEGLLGSSALVPVDDTYLHNQRIGLVVMQSDQVDRGFLYYLFNTTKVRDQIQATATGSKVRHTAPSRIEDVVVDLPPISIQRKIAAVLSAYDDVIENNNRRIKLLEEMTQRIYREWFVDFRYPGHETVALVESDLGEIPKGWITKRVSDRFDVFLGGTPSRKNPSFWTDGAVPWINSGQINRLRVIKASEMITRDALSSSSTKLMPRGTTLLAITGATLGQVSLLEIEACANQSVVGICDASGDLSEYLFLAISNSIESIIGAASGGAQQHINQQDVKDIRVLLPDEAVGKLFQSLVQPPFSLLANLLFANQFLEGSRDLLLPRLMLDQIDVSDLTISMPEPAA